MDFTVDELERLYNWYVSLVSENANELEDDVLAEKINDLLENE